MSVSRSDKLILAIINSWNTMFRKFLIINSLRLKCKQVKTSLKCGHSGLFETLL